MELFKQHGILTRFLEDPQMELTNNESYGGREDRGSAATLHGIALALPI
jgi:hypothetical protein